MFDWNDLRHFLALAEHGSAGGAARALGVDPTTVQRRIAELERRIGQSLVRREAGGYRLTALGGQLLEPARRVGASIAEFERALAATGRESVGVIRVTCPEPIVLRLTRAGLLDRFHTQHPDLKVSFSMSDRYLDLSKGEVDVALRSGDTDDGALVGRRIGDSYWAAYASRGYVERHGRPADDAALGGHALVGFDESMAGHRASAWLARVAPGVPLAARNDSVLGLVSTVKSGIGIGPLPMALGDAEPDLVRLFGPIPEMTRVWRILTTRSLRRTRRVSAFFDFMVREMDALRPIITG